MTREQDVERLTALLALAGDEPDDVARARAQRLGLDIERVSRSVRVTFLVPVGRASAHVVVTLLAVDFDELLAQGEEHGARIFEELRRRFAGAEQLGGRRGGKVEA